MKRFALTALILAAASVVAQATPTVTLTATYTGTTWKVYATVTDNDCAGLSSFQISFGGGAGPQILTSVVKASKPLDSGLGAFAGFAATFNSAGVVSGGIVTDLQAGQGTAYGDTNNSDKDLLVIQGIGQTNSSWHTFYWSPDDPWHSWVSPTLIGQGTFSGSGLLVPISGAANVLSGTTGNWHGPGNVEVANVVFGAGFFAPEPATIGLLAVGGLALLRRR